MAKLINYLRFLAEAARGMWRLYWGRCPSCNSSIPANFDCKVCRWHTVPDKFWQDSWVLQLHHKYFTH